MNSTNLASDSMDNLYPALIQSFVIILCGYFAGRLNLISETEAKGINIFVGTFSLPSLIFLSLVELELNQVNWLFLLSILIAKSVVFFSVIIITLIIGKTSSLGRAGIFAIFCTQSNDFAIGYPIVAALYHNTHPEYAKYLYLMAPISLAILNPVSFILMEVGKHHDRNSNELLMNNSIPNNFSAQNDHSKIFTSVIKNICMNPVIVMTVLGMMGNFIFKHNIPLYFKGPLQVLGSAFSASALFVLGLRMVGKLHKLNSSSLVVPGILIMMKLIVLPLVTREVISLIRPGYNESETLDLSTYGFLYGTFPSAPTVFVFATQYKIEIDLIASAMVVCTFISAPFMFVSAKMITLTNCYPSEYIKQLNAYTFDISVIGIICCLWLMIVFILSKKVLRMPHRITMCLVMSQMISCLGIIIWNSVNDKNGWPYYLSFSLFSVGVYSTRLWTTILAVSLLLLQCRSLCYVITLQPFFALIGWGIPVIITSSILIFDKPRNMSSGEKNPNFIYGASQAIVAVCLLVLCFIVTVGCLILHQRHRRRFSRYSHLASEIVASSQPLNPDEVEETTNSIDSRENSASKCCGTLSPINEDCSESPVQDIEDLLEPNSSGSRIEESLCSTRFGCAGPKREICQNILRRYQEGIDEDLGLIGEESEPQETQILRHTVFLILSSCSIFVGFALSIWTLIMDQITGIYVELSFLDSTLNFGQSIILFAIFGLDSKDIFLPVLKYWRKLWYGANTLVLPRQDELSSDTKHICEQFVTHHLQNCRLTIAADKRWRLIIYKSVFSGVQLVDWLIEVGLARDRTEAVNYAQHLVLGRVLSHINNVYNFYDRNLLYTFV